MDPMDPMGYICSLHFLPSKWPSCLTNRPGLGALAAAEAGIVQFLIRDPPGIFKRHDIELEIDTNKKKEKNISKYIFNFYLIINGIE